MIRVRYANHADQTESRRRDDGKAQETAPQRPAQAQPDRDPLITKSKTQKQNHPAQEPKAKRDQKRRRNAPRGTLYCLLISVGHVSEDILAGRSEERSSARSEDGVETAPRDGAETAPGDGAEMARG